MSDSTASTVSRAVFLSYAHEDSAAARRIADGLRGLGVEVWFDQSELRGGDAWDQKIRRQIKECALFVPVVSANTQARGEGYFRLEWKLAVERTHHMAEGIPFLAPVALDRSHEADALVPPEFMRVHWTRLTDGMPTPEFLSQIKRLLDAPRKSTAMRQAESAGPQLSPPPAVAPKHESTPAAPPLPSLAPAAESPRVGRRVPAAAWAIAVLVLAGVSVLVWQQSKPTPISVPNAGAGRSTGSDQGTRPLATEKSATVPSAPAPEQSVAVLAFADLSAARDSEYFSDGISEELINVLGRVPGLVVKGRSSSFYFKGKQATAAEKGQKLGVTYLVDGSVRRAGDTVRITAQLIRAATDEVVWSSEALNRDTKDVFAVQEEIAGLIAKQLSLKLGGSSAASTANVNPQAFELYVQARQAWNLRTNEGLDRAEQWLNRALELSPDFARAHAALADVWNVRAQTTGTVGGFDQRASPELARIFAKIRQALALDPDSAEAHASLGVSFWESWNFSEAERELRRAIAVNPSYASAHQWLGRVLASDGRLGEALAELKLGAELDPISSLILNNYANMLLHVGRNREGLAVADRALVLQPSSGGALVVNARALLAFNRVDEAVALARRIPLESPTDYGRRAEILGRAGLHAEAETLLRRVDETSLVPRSFLLLAMGRREEGLAALTAATTSSLMLGMWFCDPIVDSVRDDPRFAKFLEALGVIEAHARAQAWRKARPLEKPAAK